MPLIDLSHPIEHGMVTYPGLPAPAITDFLSRDASREKYAGQAEFHIGRIDMIANTGTYLDAPSHRWADGEDLAALPLAKLAFLPGAVIELRERSLRPEHITTDIRGRAVLIHTGWSRYWRTGTYGDKSHPFVSREAAQFLADAGVALVGIDSVNIDDMADPSRPAHTILLRSGVPVVEHLTGLDALAGREFTFFAVPAPVRGLGTFAVRAFAATNDE
jgi:kynurenine formamidase